MPTVANGGCRVSSTACMPPHQGLFPAYAGGRYDFENSVFLVSRGLARESTISPRFFNRPELVLAEIVPITAE